MFQSARLVLTGWYILILTCVVFIFSILLYQRFLTEFDRYIHLERKREAALTLPPGEVSGNGLVDELRERIWLDLLGIDGVILVGAGLASYWLAGRTLKPIETMVMEQRRFMADASHELRTPLTALKTEIEVSLRDKKIAPVDARTLLTSNLEEIDRLRRLTDDLLLLGQNGHQPPALERVSADDIVARALKKVRSLAAAKRIAVESNKSETLHFDADPDRLVDLFVILFDNAIKYSHAGGRIEVAWQRVGSKVKFIVRDFGIGVSRDALPHVFDRFYRADTARRRQASGGHGLGLAIAKDIVNRHRGEIALTSEPGDGTVVTVVLPLRH